jgi:hypothetical protein
MTAPDIRGSEMAGHIDVRSSQEEIDASIRRAFPGVTVELDRGCALGLDQIDQIVMWLENEDARPEDVSRVFDLMMSGAPATEIDAAIARSKLSE